MEHTHTQKDLYLKNDILFLADAFENFQNMCLEKICACKIFFLSLWISKNYYYYYYYLKKVHPYSIAINIKMFSNKYHFE